jgi:uncharacterized protein YndB with AHSA1/START domain
MTSNSGLPHPMTSNTTASTVDLRVGGAFSTRMKAKDGSFGFDFASSFTKVVPHHLIEMAFGGRTAVVEFIRTDGSIVIRGRSARKISTPLTNSGKAGRRFSTVCPDMWRHVGEV